MSLATGSRRFRLLIVAAIRIIARRCLGATSVWQARNRRIAGGNDRQVTGGNYG
jgi:hypothetical protein